MGGMGQDDKPSDVRYLGPWACEHANEVRATGCPCGPDCYCRRHACQAASVPCTCTICPGPAGVFCTLPAGHEGLCRFPEVSLDQLGSAGGPLMLNAVEKMRKFLTCAEEIIVFAVARLDVLTYPKWPYQALRELGEEYRKTTGDDPEAQRRRELGVIWLDFAKEAESWEQSRADGTHKIRLQQENLMKPAVSLLRHAITEHPSVPKRNTRSKAKKASKLKGKPKK